MDGRLRGRRLANHRSRKRRWGTGSRFAPFMRLRLRALQGRESEASELMAAAIELAAATGQAVAAIYAHWAAAVLYNGLARYEEASSAARQATSRPCEPLVSVWA